MMEGAGVNDKESCNLWTVCADRSFVSELNRTGAISVELNEKWTVHERAHLCW